jgi:hypothetical protein
VNLFTCLGYLAAAVIGIVIVGVIGLAVALWCDGRADQRRQQLRTATQPSRVMPDDGISVPEFIGCKPCNGKRGRCICTGNCGQPVCVGDHTVSTDGMSSALNQMLGRDGR